MRTSLLYAAGWLGAVVVATAAGFAAVDVVTADVAPVGASRASFATDDAEPVVTQRPDRLDRDAGDGPDRDRGSTGSGRRPGSDRDGDEPDGSGGRAERPLRTQVTDGGTVSARCTRDEDARLLSWSPRSGWSVHSAVPGPAATAEVSFTDDAQVLTVTASCIGLEPLFGVDTVPVQPTEDPAPPTDEPSAVDPTASG